MGHAKVLKLSEGFKNFVLSKVFKRVDCVLNRFKDAEMCHMKHYDLALRRGDLHGLAVACNNIGYLKYYDPEQYDDSVVFQAIAYYLAEKVGDVSRMGMVLTKTGKLYTTLGYCEEAMKMFQSAIECAKQARNVAREGMAWGDLGTVYRSLGRFIEAIKCHVIYRDNAAARLDVGGVAIMQHQLAMDFLLRGDLPEAERSILDCFQKLEKIRSQIGDEDESKISNFEKNQAEAHNLLQVVLTAQGKFKEAFVLSDRSRTRALSEIVQNRLSCFKTDSEQRGELGMDPNAASDCGNGRSLELNPANVEQYFKKAVAVSEKLATTLVSYSIVKEFDVAGEFEEWVYIWVLAPSGDLHFRKSRLDATLTTKVEISENCTFSLRGGRGGNSQLQLALRSMQCKNKDSVHGGIKGSLLSGPQSVGDLKRIEDLLSCDDVALTEPSLERKELNPDKWESSDVHGGVSCKSDCCNLVDGLEKASGESVPCGESSNIPCNLYVDFPSERESIDQEKLLIDQETEVRPQFNEQSITLEESSSSKEVTLQQDSSVDRSVILSQPVDPFPREDVSCGLEISTSHKPMLSNVNVQSNDKEEFIPRDDLTLPAPGSSPSLNFDVPRDNEYGEYNGGSTSNKSCDVSGPNVHSLCEHSAVSEPLGSPSPGVHSQDGESNIPQESGEMPLDTPTTDVVAEEGHSEAAKHGNPPSSEESTSAAPGEYKAESSSKKPCDMPNPNVHSPYEGHIKQEHSALSEPIGSPSPGVHSQDGDSNIPQESDEMPLDPPTTEEVAEEGPSEATKHGNPPSSEESADPTHALSEVAVKMEGSCTGDEACLSENHFENAEKESVNTKHSGIEKWKPVLNSAYRVLIEPIKNLLSSDFADSPRVTFIPQDFLLRVPFAALCEDSSNSYLVENFVISTSPSIHLLDLTVDYLSNLQEGTAPDDLSLLAVGNPVMPFEELPSLPAAAQEVRMIAEILSCPRNEIALGSRATKNHVTSVMSNFQILHFATHAVVDVSDAHGDFTHRGFIVLAKSDEHCNGVLMAEEVKQMSLRAELVVLSCCDTGLGKVTGEGVLGLSRAFIAAGAACVLVTLWKIGDDCTSQLMRYFYQEYKQSRDAAVALHKAMRSLGRSESTRSPEHWAAFAIIGATGPTVPSKR